MVVCEAVVRKGSKSVSVKGELSAPRGGSQDATAGSMCLQSVPLPRHCPERTREGRQPLEWGAGTPCSHTGDVTGLVVRPGRLSSASDKQGDWAGHLPSLNPISLSGRC